MIRTWSPWKYATGPRTDDGKHRSSQNALVHGAYSQEAKDDGKRIAELLRQCKVRAELA